MSYVEFPRISRLSASLVSQIAAGEVIERPASVIKELVENSLDAGADRIEIDIERGGSRSIRVRDNGHGIHPGDMRLALESHATSKLREASDLAAIRSLGFRGEALSSIASVSRFELTSRMDGEERAWSVTLLPGSDPAGPEPAAHERGTTVQVDDLFQAIPARRKFLRTDRTEFLHILETVRRLALSRFDVDLRLRHNRRQILQCRPAERDGERRIREIMGAAFLRGASTVDSRRAGMHLWGRLGDPARARSQSDRQYFYLNGRMIRDKRINHAVRRALEESVPQGRYPSYVLYLNIDPAAIDVNVHPTKQEVRFRNARDVHDFIYAAVADAMQADRDTQETLPGMVYGRTSSASGPAPVRQVAELYRRDRDADAATDAAPVLVSGPYILMRQGEELLLVNAVEAERRICRQRLLDNLERPEPRSRPLLVPVLTTCDRETIDLVMEHRELLARLGLALEEAGPASLRIRAIPSALDRADAQSLCREAVTVLRGGGEAMPEYLVERLAGHAAETAPVPDSAEAARGLVCSLREIGIDFDAPPQPGLWRRLDEHDLERLLNFDGR